MTYLDQMQESRCPHGVRDHRTGTNAKGQDWEGWTCPDHVKGCAPVWKDSIGPEAKKAIRTARDECNATVAAARAKRDAAVADILAGALPTGNAAGSDDYPEIPPF